MEWVSFGNLLFDCSARRRGRVIRRWWCPRTATTTHAHAWLGLSAAAAAAAGDARAGGSAVIVIGSAHRRTRGTKKPTHAAATAAAVVRSDSRAVQFTSRLNESFSGCTSTPYGYSYLCWT